MKRIYLYLVVLLGIFVFNASPALAQEDYVISGTVLDEYEKPLPGATVKAVELDKTVKTDKDGKYQILVPKGTKLMVTFVGFKETITEGGQIKLRVDPKKIHEVVVLSDKKKDYRKIKLVDPKAVIVAVDTLLKRMPTFPPAGHYDTTVVHQIIRENVYKKFKDNAEVMTGVANAYFRYKGEVNNWIIVDPITGDSVLLKDTYKITDTFCEDLLHFYQYIDYAIQADSTYGPAYALAGNVRRDSLKHDEAINWYKRGIKASPKSPDCYLAYAKLIIEKDSTEALSLIRELAKADSLYPVNIELARIYYDINELPRSFNNYNNTFWNDSLKRKHFTEVDLQNYCTSWHAIYNIDKMLTLSQKKFVDKRIYDVACYGLRLYPENVALVRSAFYTLQRLGLNDSAKVYAEKLFVMPNTKFNTLDYLAYARVYSAHGDLGSADKMYGEAFELCLKESADTKKEYDETNSERKRKRLSNDFERLKLTEDAIVNEHTRLYSDDYEKKISIANYYIDKKKVFGRKDYVAELNQLGAALAVKAQVVDTAKMVNAWKQVDAVYEEMAEISPDDAPNAILTRLEVADYIDDLTGEKTGVDLSQSIIDENKDIAFSLTGTQKECLIKAYEYQLYYHYSLWIKEGGKRNNRRSLHWQKLDQYLGDLMMIDGNNSVAARVSNNIY